MKKKNEEKQSALKKKELNFLFIYIYIYTTLFSVES